LFAERRAVNTSLIWVAFFCNLLVIYFLNAWLPTVLKQTGVPLETTFRLTGALSWGGVVSILILSPIVDRLGATSVTVWLYIGAALSILGVGLSGSSVPLLALTIVLGGGCITASQSFINIIATGLYPTTIRSTGVAWALGVGRAGTMLGPVLGSVMLKAEFAPATILFSAAIPAAIAALAMLALRRQMRNRPPAIIPAPSAI
jgi:AAHS family 4-hydroxybenzoate transporter-like MFS transporter